MGAMARPRRRGPTLIQRSRSISSREKARFHHEDGAGRSKVRRPFFALNADDEAAIVARLDAGLSRAIDKTG